MWQQKDIRDDTWRNVNAKADISFRRSCSEPRQLTLFTMGAGLFLLGLVITLSMYNGEPIDWVLVAVLGGVFAFFTLIYGAVWFNALQHRDAQLRISDDGLSIPTLVAKSILASTIERGLASRFFSRSSSRTQAPMNFAPTDLRRS